MKPRGLVGCSLTIADCAASVHAFLAALFALEVSTKSPAEKLSRSVECRKQVKLKTVKHQGLIIFNRLQSHNVLLNFKKSKILNIRIGKYRFLIVLVDDHFSD